MSDITINVPIHNRYDIEVIDSITGKIKQKAYGTNALCINGYFAYLSQAHSMGTYSTYSMQRLYWGNGEGTPSSSDTGMFNSLGSKTVRVCDNCTFTKELTRKLVSIRTKFVLYETDSPDTDITEVGISFGQQYGGSSYQTWPSSWFVSHSLLKDMNGNPISIHKTSTDIINVYFTFNVVFDDPKVDLRSDISVGSTYDTSIVPWMLGALKGVDFRSTPTYRTMSVNQYAHYKLTGGDTTNGPITFSSDSKTVSITFSRLGVNSANYTGGIRMFKLFGNLYSRVSDHFPGTTITGEAIGTGDGSTREFSTSFPVGSNYSIYIDGQISNPSVTTGVTTYPDYLRYISKSSTPNNIIDVTESVNSCPGVGKITSPGNVTPYYVYNPYSDENHRIGSITLYFGYTITQTLYLDVSNNLNDWTTVTLGTFEFGNSTLNIPEEYGSYTYMYIHSDLNRNVEIGPYSMAHKNIIFDSPPEEGSVITATYHTPAIPKDINHVLDMSASFKIGEYTEN